MNKLVLALSLLFLAIPAFAAVDREFLLTDDGTLYTIESSVAWNNKYNPDIRNILRLNVQKGDRFESIVVPASQTNGIHIDPALAYNAATDTVYVFWQHMPNMMSSELLFSSYRGGDWSDATSIEPGPFRMRFNLNIGVTRTVSATDKSGAEIKRPELNIHAVWWEQSGGEERARYAMLTMDGLDVRGIHLRELSDFSQGKSNPVPFHLDPDFDRNFLRTPAIFEMPKRESVDVLFANWHTNRLQLVSIRPVDKDPNGVLHIPMGIWRQEIDPPRRVKTQDSEKSAVIRGTGNNNFAFYFSTKDKVHYRTYRDGAWSEPQSFLLSGRITLDAAENALVRVLSE